MGRITYFIIIFYFVLIFPSIVLCDCGSKIENVTTDFYAIESFIFNGSIKECGCSNSENICIRKCCGLDYIINNQTCVLNNSSNLLKNVTIYKSGYEIKDNFPNVRLVPGMVKCNGKENFLQFLPDHNPEDGGNVQNDGQLWISSLNIFFDHDNYCLDYSEEFGLVYDVCIDNVVGDLTVADYLNIIGMGISLPFFLVTFIVYAILPERNLHAMCLMSHVFAIFMAYLLSISLVFKRGHWEILACRGIVLTILCCFMVSIFWVNLMAFDIFSTFRGSRSHSTNKKRDDRRRFVIYNFYAWGIPLLFIALIIILSQTVTPNVWYDPGLRGSQCIIGLGLPTLLYYYGPLAILIISNIAMFITTAFKIRKTQKDTAMLTTRGSKKHGSKDNDKQMFQLFVRLLFAMGVNWSIEILSWAINWQVENIPPAVWYISDFCNAAYGVAVFILFVCKKNIWKALKKRYYKAIGREQTEMTVTQSSLMSEE